MLSHNHNNYYEHNFSGAVKLTEYSNVIGVHLIADSFVLFYYLYNMRKKLT